MDEFLRQNWQREPLHLRRADPHFYDGLFSIAQVDALIGQSRPRYPQLRVVSNYQPIPADLMLQSGWFTPVLPGFTPDARSNPLFGAYDEGYTIIVEMQKLWQPVSELCQSIDETFNHKATAELYLTPASAQGFGLHFDHHEVFILQIEGAKRWKVYPPVKELPVTEEPVQRSDVGEPLIDEVVEAGDLLYIPRGFPHEGITSDTFSLHITFGMFVYRWQQLLEEAINELTERDVRFRDALPMGFLGSENHNDLMRAKVKELLKALAEDHDADAAIERLRIRYLSRLAAVPDGQFDQLNRLGSLSMQSTVEKRAGRLCHVSANNGSATIRFPGGHVTSPGWVKPALEFIQRQTRPFAVADLPAMDDSSKLVLVRRLVKEGMLRLV